MKVAITALMLMSMLLTGCRGMTGQGSYQPPIIPLKVSADTNGKISFDIEEEIDYPTPLGTFSVGVVFNPDDYFHTGNTLTVRLDCKDYFYDLSEKDFSIEFESGYYEKIGLTMRGDNVLLELRRHDGNTTNELADCPIPNTESGNSGSDTIIETDSQFLKSITANNFQELSGFQASGDCASGFLSKDDCSKNWGLEFTLTNNSNVTWKLSQANISCSKVPEDNNVVEVDFPPHTQLTLVCSLWPGGIRPFDLKDVIIYASSDDEGNNLCIYVYTNQAKKVWTSLDCP